MSFRTEHLAEGVTLILGDCLEVLPTLGRFDAVVTDPPYGIGFGYATHDDDPEKWFALMDAVVPLCRTALTMIDPMEVLREAVAKAGSQTKFAAQVGVSPQYVNDLVHGRRAFEGERILSALGLERNVTFVRAPTPTPHKRKAGNK